MQEQFFTMRTAGRILPKDIKSLFSSKTMAARTRSPRSIEGRRRRSCVPGDKPEKNDDRDRHSDQPQQTRAHFVLLTVGSQLDPPQPGPAAIRKARSPPRW